MVPADADSNTEQPIIERAHGDKSQATPLPKVQLAVLVALFLAEPITSTVIYPFANEMVNEFGITHGDPRKTGYYVGLIESIFFATESVMILQWGRFSDRFGRKPVLLIGVSGLALSQLCFGLSRAFWPLVISRSIAGALNGNVGVVKSMLGEITDDSNMAQAFAFIPVTWAGGSAIGPLLGGLLSHPARRFPYIFRSQFWKDYPYFLPCFAAATYSIFVFFIVLIFLKETLTTAKLPSRSKIPDKSTTAPLSQDSESILDAPGPETPLLGLTLSPPSLSSIFTSRVKLAVSNYMLLSLIDIALTVLQPLVFSTPIDAGGLGLDPVAIGLALGIFGLVDGIIEVTCFAWLCKTLGTGRLYRIAIASFFAAILAFPVMNWVAKNQGLVSLVWTVMGMQFFVMILDGMAFACTSMYITASAPSPNLLGSVNGLAQTGTSVMRAVGPACATSFFAFSVEKNLLRGNLIYVILALTTLVAFAAVLRLPDEPWPRADNGVNQEYLQNQP